MDTAGVELTRAQLQGLLQSLKSLGQESPQCLVSLTQIVQPTLAQEVRIPLLEQIFKEVPNMLLSLSTQHLYENIMKPANDAVCWRLLLELRTLQQILSGVSNLQLLQLTNNTIPPGSAQHQLAFLRHIQGIFQMWSNNNLLDYHRRLTSTPAHAERQVLTQLEPKITAEALPFFIAILKMTEEELLSFKQWLESLHHTHLIYLVNLLQMETQVLLDVKRRLAPQQSTSFNSTYNVSSGLPEPFEDDMATGEYDHTVGPRGYDPTNAGTSRFGKRTRGDEPKELVNIRDSGILDTSLSHMGLDEDEAQRHTKVRRLMGSSGGGAFMPMDQNYSIGMEDAMGVDGFDEHGMMEDDDAFTVMAFAGDNLGSSWTFPVPQPRAMPDAVNDSMLDSSARQRSDLTTTTLLTSSGMLGGLGASAMFNVPMPSMESINLAHTSQIEEQAHSNPLRAPLPAPTPATPVTPVSATVVIPPAVVAQSQLSVPATPVAAAAAVPLPMPQPALPLNLQPQLQLRIAKQPPAKTVYQRILKPFPSVMLVGSAPMDAAATLFVEAALLRSDSDTELPLILDGNKTIRISTGVFATFKRLKILSTSQQQGTLFRLRFTLKRYVGNVFEILHNAVTVSNPIEVFSHTQYLTNKKGNAPPTPATVLEVLPNAGAAAGGSRVAILGSNFVHTPQLRVKFGDQIVTCQFHESGTLVCIVPPSQIPHRTVEVRVSNDGVDYSGTSARFSYLG